jgi:hypothetical protein
MNRVEEGKLISIISGYIGNFEGMSSKELVKNLQQNDLTFGLSERSLWRKVKKAREIPQNVLVIGDLHEPFTRKGYFDHCRNVYEDFNCTRTVLIGDILDNHYSSYHETDPDGLSAGDELGFAVKKLEKWHNAFLGADVILGNHDLLIMRKAMSSGVSKRWVKEFKDVLETPTWNFHHELYIDGVMYHHGTGSGGIGGARLRSLSRNESTVMGHTHTEASINWHANHDKRFFGMYVGCGVDEKAYAMEYGKNFKRKMIISCGTVLNNGKLPIVHPMELD